MTNIWAFFNQTLAVSLIAVILIFIKWLFQDKLSPRWQYGVCTILVLRILLPAQSGKGIFMPMQLWVEIAKATVEKGIDSAYTRIYVPVKVEHIVPMIQTMPNSFTDWLFVIYIAGIIVMLLWYFSSYMRLRFRLRRGGKVSEKEQRRIDEIASKYQLKSCRAVLAEDISTAFVCCGFRPVLVLPACKEQDEKIILHELLHLKYHDEWQSVGWCILRCLHWCNPFLQYVFHRIQNDMESLCDQRVLEHLEGEERRDYGLILLDMANETYARTPGTSSISNGGKNISRRIAAIVRFKKYPKGMALVSVCIAILLFAMGLLQNVSASDYRYLQSDYEPKTEAELDKAMALARLQRCTTLAGALDTYAKGLLYEQGVYIAIVSPFSEHEALVNKMKENEAPQRGYMRLESGAELERLSDQAYWIYNLKKVEEGCYQACLLFSIFDELDSKKHSVLVPVEASYQEEFWNVRECGERILLEQSAEEKMYGGMNGNPMLSVYEAVGETAKVAIQVYNDWYVDDLLQGMDTRPFVEIRIGDSLKRDAEFLNGNIWQSIHYAYTPKKDGTKPTKTVGIQCVAVNDLEEKVDFPAAIEVGESGGGADSNGLNWTSNRTIVDGETAWETGFGQSIANKDYDKGLPVGYRAAVYWDGVLVEELLLTEADVSNEMQTQYLTQYKGYSQSSVYMSASDKKVFKAEKDQVYAFEKKQGKIKELSEENLDKKLEQYMFSEELSYEELEEEKQKLEEYGIYYFETTNSKLMDIYMRHTKVNRPEIFYNANNKSWIVACSGACLVKGGIESKELELGAVGDREVFGIRFSETTGEYNSHISHSAANIADQENIKREETQNRSDGDGKMGFLFELEDYVYDADLFDGEKNYVGARWFATCTYGHGFENYGGNVTAIYKHTE